MDGLLLVAHGSRDPRSAPVAHDVAALAAEHLPGVVTRACFLELSEPTPDATLTELAAAGVDTLTVVPFLLSEAYHAGTDVPDVVAAARDRFGVVRHAPVLAPDPLLLDALELRLSDTGRSDRVVLAAAGSSKPEANTVVRTVAVGLAARRGAPVTAAYASATEPTVGDAVTAAYRAGASRVAVATYLLAPGYFADRIAEEAVAAGATEVSEPLGASAPIAALVARRYVEAGAAPASPTAG